MKRIKVILQLTDAQFSKLEALSEARWQPGERRGFRSVVERMVLEVLGERQEGPSEGILVRVNPDYAKGAWWDGAARLARRDTFFAECMAKVKTSPKGAMVPLAWLVQAREIRASGWSYRPLLFEGQLPPKVFGKKKPSVSANVGLPAEVHEGLLREAARLGVLPSRLVRSLISDYAANPKPLDFRGLDYGPLTEVIVTKMQADVVKSAHRLARGQGITKAALFRAIVISYLRRDFRRLRKIDFHPQWGKFGNAQKAKAA